MMKITDEIISKTSDKAKTSERNRCNYNFHKSYGDPIQRFLNAVEPNSYLRNTRTLIRQRFSCL
jgi:cupin fold WbuC family metalloprotein